MTVGPGERSSFPSGWSHHVRSLSPSISVSMTNFTKLLDTDDPSYPVPASGERASLIPRGPRATVRA